MRIKISINLASIKSTTDPRKQWKKDRDWQGKQGQECVLMGIYIKWRNVK